MNLNRIRNIIFKMKSIVNEIDQKPYLQYVLNQKSFNGIRVYRHFQNNLDTINDENRTL